jgi:N-acetylneuraminate synthase
MAMADIETWIGGRPVGRGHRPMIVAELSANHNASLDRALLIVRTAAECGADCIKLQTFRPESLTIDSSRPEFFIDNPGGLWHGRRLWDLYREAHTPWEWHRPIFEAARAAGLACISTACDLESLEFLIPLGVDAIKIASFELIHLPLIEAAAKCGRPVLLSTGMANIEELNEAVATLRASRCNEFILLKCTSAYPSTEADANILTIPDMRERFGCDIGLSDHTLGPYTAFAAIAQGAVVIEKHFTLARRDGGLDAAFSLEPVELRELVDGADLVWRSLGDVSYGPLAAESASIKERPSIYAVEAVKRGEAFTDRNIRVIRPADGLAPKYYRALVGRICARDIAAGTPLSWEFVKGGAPAADKPVRES